MYILLCIYIYHPLHTPYIPLHMYLYLFTKEAAKLSKVLQGLGHMFLLTLSNEILPLYLRSAQQLYQ